MSSIGVFASLFDTSGRILLVRQAYAAHRWTTPGGRVEDGESPLMALEREVLEEIGCEVQVAHLIGVYAKPYRDDLVLSFAATLVGGTPRAVLSRDGLYWFFPGRRHSGRHRVQFDGARERCFGWMPWRGPRVRYGERKFGCNAA